MPGSGSSCGSATILNAARDRCPTSKEATDTGDRPPTSTEDALVVTRAGARKEREEEELMQKKQQESGAQPTAVDEIDESEREEQVEFSYLSGPRSLARNYFKVDGKGRS